MPTPADPRKKPTSVKIHVSSGTGVDITWADGHASHYDFAFLREECPCATCNDEREKKHAFKSVAPGFASSPVLPMFKPKPSAKAATQVGSYAIQINFTDGHSTGIYSYDLLRNICPCAECAKAFRTAAG
jgi:prepilin-type processing-associated H-X9-DG protein